MATPDAVTDGPPEKPAPKQRQRPGSYSGRLLLRMPASLHEELARASDRDGVSLNQFITGVLASAVSWRNEDASAVRPAAETPKPGSMTGRQTSAPDGGPETLTSLKFADAE